MLTVYILVCPDALMELIKKVTMSPVIPANILTGLRALNNLFKNTGFHQWLQFHRSEVCLFHSPNGTFDGDVG